MDISMKQASWLSVLSVFLKRFCFFFQAEDGIRDHCVTEVQTCALPIWERMCTRTEILDAIWGDRFVSDSALASRIAAARAAVADDGRAQRVIRTVHGR